MLLDLDAFHTLELDVLLIKSTPKPSGRAEPLHGFSLVHTRPTAGGRWNFDRFAKCLVRVVKPGGPVMT